LPNGGAGARTESERPTFDLSVVISTHDRPVQLREAIAAVVGQDHPGPIETIVVWDKTTPELELVVDDPHRPVRVLSNDRTPGLPGSRNCGAAAARGPVLGFCDDDDLWLPDKARRQLALLAETGADACCAGMEVYVDGKIVPRRGDEDGVLRYADLLRSRPMMEDIPGGFAEDYEWRLRATRTAPMPVVPDPLVQVRWIVQSHFKDQWGHWEAALGHLIAAHPDFAREPRGRARLEGQIAVAIAAQGRRRDALAQIRRTLRWSAREPRAAIALAVLAGIPVGRISAELNKRGRGL
jgi:hypothetical protein